MTSTNPQVQRYVTGPIFISTHLPPLRVEIDPAFTYLGNLEFGLKGIAQVDRHLFIEAEGQAIQRLIIFQFEGFLDNNSYTNTLKLCNDRRVSPAAIVSYPSKMPPSGAISARE